MLHRDSAFVGSVTMLQSCFDQESGRGHFGKIFSKLCYLNTWGTRVHLEKADKYEIEVPSITVLVEALAITRLISKNKAGTLNFPRSTLFLPYFSSQGTEAEWLHQPQGKGIVWHEDCQQEDAFQNFKKFLVSGSVLMHSDDQGP